MSRTNVLLCVLVIMCFASSVDGQEGEVYGLSGGDFSIGSVGVVRNEYAHPNGAVLVAFGEDAYAIYEIKVPSELSMFSARAALRNPRFRDLDIYLYNYGTRREQRLLSKPGLDSRWMKWETCLVDGEWKSRSPEFISARDPSGALDFVGEYGLVRLLLYADGGIPPHEDALFFLGGVVLASYPISDILRQVVDANSSVYIEGDSMLVTEAIGNAPDNVRTIAQAKAMARRAATTIAQRNLTAVVGELNERTSGSMTVRTVAGTLVGARVRSTEDLADGRVKVTMELPVSMVVGRPATEENTDTP
jgi:hypothetical protein